MSIEPDSKDWTWVLERPCPECGFDASSVSLDEIPGLIRSNAEQWPVVLRHATAGDRPRADRWSPLEYACHVRDVFRLFDMRLHRMLDEDDPTFANWDQDETAVAEQYGEQDPAEVSRDLVAAGEQMASSLAAVSADELDRTGTRSDGARFTVETFARYLIHDPVHHLWDVRPQA
jgi:hypothetical protein